MEREIRNMDVNTSSLKISAVVDIMPLALAVVPWGILCGSLAIQVGLTAFQSQLMSLLVFAGAAQLSALTIVSGGGALSSLLGSTAVISSRHLLYSATFRDNVINLPFVKRCLIAFLLTDEMFAVTEKKIKELGYFSTEYAVISGLVFYLIWNISTGLGIFLGSMFSDLESLGLEFAIAATFIAMVIPNIKTKPLLLSVLTSSMLSLYFYHINMQNGVIVSSVIGMLSGFLLDQKNSKVYN